MPEPEPVCCVCEDQRKTVRRPYSDNPTCASCEVSIREHRGASPAQLDACVRSLTIAARRLIVARNGYEGLARWASPPLGKKKKPV